MNAAEVIVTDAVFGNASPLMEPTRSESAARVCCRCSSAAIIPMVTGFNGATADGRPTTLGRGGSDFSASILAAALDAAELWIWTDVDGIMTADPRLVPDAEVLDEITYTEAAELAYNGAKVLHPRTLAPLVEKQIPVWSKNSFAPEKPGTRIVPELSAGNCGARAVTSMANVALVSHRTGQRRGERRAGDGAGARCAGPRERGSAGDLQLQLPPELLLPGAQRGAGAAPCRRSKSALALELAHGYVQPHRGGSTTSGCWPSSAKACAARRDWRGASSRPFRART